MNELTVVLIVLAVGWLLQHLSEKGKKKDAEGPWCSVDDLERDWNEYRKHVDRAVELLMSTTHGANPLVTKPGARHAIGELGEVRFTYLGIMRGNVEDFIEKIKSFRSDCRHELGISRMSPYCCDVYERDTAPVESAMKHAEAARRNAENIDAELHFFLCDFRSPFDAKASLYGGDCTPAEVSRYYMGGKRIVKANAERIQNAISSFAKFANENGVK